MFHLNRGILGIGLFWLLIGCSAVQVRSKSPVVKTETEVLKPLGIKNCQAALVESGPYFKIFQISATRMDWVKEKTVQQERKEVLHYQYSPVNKIGEMGTNYASLGMGVLADLFLRLKGDALEGAAKSETSYFHNLIMWTNWINPLTNAVVDEDNVADKEDKLGALEVSFAEKIQETPDAPLQNWPIIVKLTSGGYVSRQELLTDAKGILRADLFELIRKANLKSADEVSLELQIAPGNLASPDTPVSVETFWSDTFMPSEVIRGRLPLLKKEQMTANIWAHPQLQTTFKALEIVQGSKDGLFRGGDHGFLNIVVVNQGKGDAFDVNLSIQGMLADLQVDTPPTIPMIKSGAEMTFAIPVKLPLSIQSHKAHIIAKATEAFGNDSAPLDIHLDYQPALLPQLEIDNIWFKDGQEGLAKGNDNQILENGEQIEVWVSVTNLGTGTAQGTTLSLEEASTHCVVLQGTSVVGEIPPATSKIAKFALALPSVLKQTAATFVVTGQDQRGVGNFTKHIPVEYHQRQPQLMATAQITSENHPGSFGAIERGKSGELILTVSNQGNYAAEKVTALILPLQDGIVLPQQEIMIGRIPADSGKHVFKIPIVVQNRLEAQQAKVRIEITQKDFPAIPMVAEAVIHDPEIFSVQLGGGATTAIQRDQKPTILMTYPRGDIRLQAEKIRLSGAVIADHRIHKIEVWVNNTLHKDLPGRGIAITDTPDNESKRFFEMEVSLTDGLNRVRVAATDSQGQRSEEKLNIFKEISEKRMHVLVVGIDRYDDPGIPPLSYAQADAKAIYDFFSSSPQSPARPEDVHLLTAKVDENGCDTSYRGIKKAISRYLAQKVTNAEDSVLLYFAGHGVTGDHPTKGKSYYLMARDTEQADLLGTSMETAELNTLWNTIPTKQRILIVDACDSAALVGALDGVILVSAQKGQKALELPAQEHGLFTWSLLQGLKGKADGILNLPDGRVSIVELNAYLQREVPPLARKGGGEQTPDGCHVVDLKHIFLTESK